MKVIKENDFKVGICSVRPILEDKAITTAFESGQEIEVTVEQFKKLTQLGWAKEVKDDSDSENINQESTSRDTTTN